MKTLRIALIAAILGIGLCSAASTTTTSDTTGVPPIKGKPPLNAAPTGPVTARNEKPVIKKQAKYKLPVECAECKPAIKTK